MANGKLTLQNNLSEILGKRRIKITELSEGTGVSRTTLTALYYARVKMIRWDTLMSICDYLQIPLNELIEYQPKKVKR
ncbi:helix-turn-helix domain-containing protein [Furfurilactobacillus rossiae]|uniref:HTH cro/C1-type domain-containing protein n=1 Tax=Furfurilactobacillus rossiae DSM 15814 TaxID=1114972 RepID=A0A0R1RIB2_9LACO|nr:helix-turn-helix transcriptional regulator [Furfurilactobacillus rossiae]KRL56637.1 hypothetical protein FD35_GL001733 [Furfurilactobacillus rossiae DSM 15814]QFR66461.1 helix-turn-helix domain-containing protein [Furfurilactobacillus rossiae]QLE61921.1 hypothetical protein LROSRS0_1876 [Furfurilactobacillus rossiae]